MYCKVFACSSLDEFYRNLSDNIDDNSDFVFRGQYDAAWPLNTSFQRFIRNMDLESFALDAFSSHLERYIKLREELNDQKDNEDREAKIAYAQHYGLATIYMDWTTVVRNALFFAFCDEIINPKEHEKVGIYAFKYRNLESLSDVSAMKELIRREDGIDLFRKHGLYLIKPPKILNKRLSSQSGLFLSIEGDSNLSNDLNQLLNSIYHCYNFNSPILYKFTLQRNLALSVLKKLNIDSGISFRTLFPDETGIAMQAKFDFICK